MTNPMKIKGTTFERVAVEFLNRFVKNSTWKRIPGSGAIGTSLGEALLTADISGKVDAIPRSFKVEAKVGYGGATQFTLKKEWLDQIIKQAKESYSIPFLIGKFSGARAAGGVQMFVVMDVDTFASVLNHITNLQEELDKQK